ncbi:unnamed protein product [Effrenium voratum]|uniref:Uncharacterized protein n=1 Tax=Effrenium voratum TaxID=2562239 RepID=A0AA36N320_9DINO|nr:unnamed protein product [Effrenium voratum]
MLAARLAPGVDSFCTLIQAQASGGHWQRVLSLLEAGGEEWRDGPEESGPERRGARCSGGHTQCCGRACSVHCQTGTPDAESVEARVAGQATEGADAEVGKGQRLIGPVSGFLRSSLASLRGKLLWRYFLFQLFRLWRLPAEADLPPGRHLLILGSSVAKGEGAEAGPEPNLGWPQRLSSTLQEKGWHTTIRAVEWTNSQLWYDLITTKTTEEQWRPFSVVILSLSLGNEGFCFTESEEHLREIGRRFLTQTRMSVRALRLRLSPSARLVLGGPYANDLYTAQHMGVVDHVRQQMSQWEEVDYFVDFLQESGADLKGHWLPNASRDPGHPNSVGHEGMFRCMDLPKMFGDLW